MNPWVSIGLRPSRPAAAVWATAVAAALILGLVAVSAAAPFGDPLPGEPVPVEPEPPPPGEPDPPGEPEPPPPQPAAGIAVSFRQLHWLAEDGSVLVSYSRVGEADFAFDSSAVPLLVGAGAFVNLVVEGAGGVEWSVRNLYLAYPDEARMLESGPSVQFALGDFEGEPVTSVLYGLSVTPEPLSDAGGVVADLVALVAEDHYRTGGLNGGGSGLSAIPQLIGPWGGAPALAGAVGTPVPVRRSGSALAGGNRLPAVAEDHNGCAPGAVARSIRYLAGNARVPSPAVQDIYDDLYDAMGTTIAAGTADWAILPGKQAYVNWAEIPIVSGYDDFPWQGPVGDVHAYMGDVMTALNNGADVEILIDWFPDGGHAAMVTDVRWTGDSYQITFVDDPEQGDGWAENEEHTIWIDAEGCFGYGCIEGFIIEFWAP